VSLIRPAGGVSQTYIAVTLARPAENGSWFQVLLQPASHRSLVLWLSEYWTLLPVTPMTIRPSEVRQFDSDDQAGMKRNFFFRDECENQDVIVICF
jgi:hypothetical protein